MKKSSFLLGGALLLATLFTTSCKEIMSNLDQPVSSYLELKKSSSILEPGQTCTIEASTISTSPITYKSLNPDKATVDSKGVVTAVDDGEATIVVETAANENYVAGVAEFKVYVRTPDLFDPLTLEAKADGNINISFTNYFAGAPELEEPIIYSINGGEEKSVTASTSFAVKTGDKVQFKSKNKTLARRFKNGDYYYNQYVRIRPQVQCAVYGNAMSMVSPDGNWHLNREIKEKLALGYLFYGATNLVNDETRNLTLPATTLTDSCYYYTFRNCYGLTRAPELPAKEIKNSSYRYMFQGCLSLTEVPDINVKTIGERGCCYMFGGCTALTTAGAITVETVGEYGLSEMFENCYNLTKAGAISVKNVGNSGLRWMYYYCTALTEAPAITVENVDDYGMASMFYGCNNITKANAINIKNADGHHSLAWLFNGTGLTEAPAISLESLGDNGCWAMFYNCQNLKKAGAITVAKSTGNNAFSWMFEECVNLEEAPALTAETLGNSACWGMYSNCQKLKKVNAITAKTVGDGAFQELFKDKPILEEAVAVNAEKMGSWACYQMFYNCPKLEKAPTLSAEKLANGCYYEMFGNCSSLETAPELKASELPEWCYGFMFNGCSKLSSVKCLATKMTGEYTISYMLAGAGTEVTKPIFTRSTDNNKWEYCGTLDFVSAIDEWKIPENWTIDPAITAASAPRRASARVSSEPIKAPVVNRVHKDDQDANHMKGALPEKTSEPSID